MALKVTTTISSSDKLDDVNVNLDVMPKFAALMKESVGADSFYVRMKETLDELLDKQQLHSNVDVTALITNVLTSVTNATTATCMQTALQWVSTEKELLLKKFQISKDLEIADEDMLLKKAQVEKTLYETIATQAQTWRMYGKTHTSPDDRFKLISFELVDPNVGIDVSRTSLENDNIVEQKELIKSQLIESYAGIHRSTAETVSNFGAWGYMYGKNGLTQSVMTPARDNNNAEVVPVIAVQRTGMGHQNNLTEAQLTESYAKVHQMTSENVTTFGKWRYGYDDEGIVHATMQAGPVGPMSIPKYEEALKNLDLIDSQLKTAQANIHRTTAEAVTQYGRWVYNYTDTGLQSAAMTNGIGGSTGTVVPISDPQRVNLVHQGNLLESQLVESYAGIHKATAETVTNMGRWEYLYTKAGLQEATMTVGQGGIDGIVEPLSDSQRIIAKEQAKGYAYNAWANSVSASAGMIGTVLASDQSPSSLTNAITAFNASLNSLRTVKGPYGANP